MKHYGYPSSQNLQGLWLVPFILLIVFLSFRAVAQSCEDECSQNSANALICQAEGGIWHSVTCKCRNMSPIVISLSRNGYHLTSASDGVAFDLDASGSPEQIGWTSANSDDVFLSWIVMATAGLTMAKSYLEMSPINLLRPIVMDSSHLRFLTGSKTEAMGIV